MITPYVIAFASGVAYDGLCVVWSRCVREDRAVTASLVSFLSAFVVVSGLVESIPNRVAAGFLVAGHTVGTYGAVRLKQYFEAREAERRGRAIARCTSLSRSSVSCTSSLVEAGRSVTHVVVSVPLVVEAVVPPAPSPTRPSAVRSRFRRRPRW